jgi:hypothetical protein
MIAGGLFILGTTVGRMSVQGTEGWFINFLLGIIGIILMMEGMISQEKRENQ